MQALHNICMVGLTLGGTPESSTEKLNAFPTVSIMYSSPGPRDSICNTRPVGIDVVLGFAKTYQLLHCLYAYLKGFLYLLERECYRFIPKDLLLKSNI